MGEGSQKRICCPQIKVPLLNYLAQCTSSVHAHIMTALNWQASPYRWWVLDTHARAIHCFSKQHNCPCCLLCLQFSVVAKAGEGTYGIVYKAINRKDPLQVVAIKEMRHDEQVSVYLFLIFKSWCIIKGEGMDEVRVVAQLCATNSCRVLLKQQEVHAYSHRQTNSCRVLLKQ